MTIANYVNAVKDRLVLDPLISDFQVLRERATLTDGYLRVKTTLVDGSFLEFAEYVQHVADDDSILVVTYSYHWGSADGSLIRRWDNTPHFPDLSDFPHHCHDGATGAVKSSPAMDIFRVLDEIGRTSHVDIIEDAMNDDNVR